MPAGRLIDHLKLTPLVWGRCFSVVAADFEYASGALDDIASDSRSALRELEGLHSARVRDRNALLSGDIRCRPVGPFSSVLLEALSIRSSRFAETEEPLSGWLCHLHEADAITDAKARFARFFADSAANGLSARIQVYSARIAGRFAAREDVLRLLSGRRAANDAQTLSDSMAELRSAGIDGFVVEHGQDPSSAIVFRSCAISQLRLARNIEVLCDGGQVIVRDECVADQDNELREPSANPGLTG